MHASSLKLLDLRTHKSEQSVAVKAVVSKRGRTNTFGPVVVVTSMDCTITKGS